MKHESKHRCSEHSCSPDPGKSWGVAQSRGPGPSQTHHLHPTVWLRPARTSKDSGPRGWVLMSLQIYLPLHTLRSSWKPLYPSSFVVLMTPFYKCPTPSRGGYKPKPTYQKLSWGKVWLPYQPPRSNPGGTERGREELGERAELGIGLNTARLGAKLGHLHMSDLGQTRV